MLTAGELEKVCSRTQAEPVDVWKTRKFIEEQFPEPVMPACPINKVLKGQKAIVTGSSSGIGKGIATALGPLALRIDHHGATDPVASRLTVGASTSVTEVTSPGTSSTGASARSGARSGASGRLGVPDGDDPVCATSATKAAVAAAGVPAGPGPSWASPDVVTGAAPSATDDPAPVEVGRSVIDPTARCTTPSPTGTTGSAGRAVGGGGAVTNDRTGVASARTGN